MRGNGTQRQYNMFVASVYKEVSTALEFPKTSICVGPSRLIPADMSPPTIVKSLGSIISYSVDLTKFM